MRGLFVVSALACIPAFATGAGAAEREYDPAPTSPIPEGWAELDLRVETPGAAVAVDTAQFCGLPCRMLLVPGEHVFTLVAPGFGPRDHMRTLLAGESLLFPERPTAEPSEGGALVVGEEPSAGEGSSHDAWGIALYIIGAISILTATGLVAYDVAMNVGYAQGLESGDWTSSYVAAGLAPVGIALAIWGAVREAD
jgi:hypothetical protein